MTVTLNLDHLESLDANASPRPWQAVNDKDIAQRTQPYLTGTVMEGGTSADRQLIANLRNAAPTLIRLARTGLELERRIVDLDLQNIELRQMNAQLIEGVKLLIDYVERQKKERNQSSRASAQSISSSENNGESQ